MDSETTEPRSVLVTGGSRGIGAALVRAFVRARDRVFLTYRSGARQAEELVEELGEGVSAYPFDQGDRSSHERLLAMLPDPVDVLVNNAGLGSRTVESYAPGSTHEQDRALLQVNAVGPLWLTQALVPGMLERGYGKVVSIASVGGGVNVFPSFRLADGMSKAAVAFLGRQLAAELATTPVDVFTVCPGATDTSMFRASTLEGLDAQQEAAFKARLPKGRLIDPEEIAELVVWLCGEQGRVLHGAVLDASLGLGVHPGLVTGGQW